MAESSTTPQGPFDRAVNCLNRFQNNQDVTALLEGIGWAQVSVSVAQPYTQPWMTSLCLLVALRSHQVIVQPSDDEILDQAFLTMRKAASGLKRGLGLPSFYNSAARELFIRRYHRRGNLEDLETAVSLTDKDDLKYISLLDTLADRLMEYYSVTKTHSLLERAIQCREELVKVVEEENRFKEHQLLGNMLWEASGLDQSIDVLNKAEQHATAAYEAIHRYGGQDFTINTNLGDILLRRFGLSKNLVDLIMARLFLEEAVEKTTTSEPAYFSQLNDKFCVLTKWAEHTGELGILREAFELAKSNVEYTAAAGDDDDHIIAAIHFGDISLKLPRTEDRHIHHEKAAQYLARVETKIEHSVAHQDLALATHSQLLLELFRETQDQKLLKEAKDKIDKALNASHPSSGLRAKYIMQRGLILTDQARMTMQSADWEIVVKQLEEALKLQHENLIDMGDLFYSLSMAYMELFRLKPDAKLIQSAIEHGLRSLKYLTQGKNQQHKAQAYNLISKAYFTRFETERGSTDIEESIKFGKLAISDDLNPKQVGYLIDLATVMRGKSTLKDTKDDIESALLYARRACELEKSTGKAGPETYGILSLILLDVMRLNISAADFDEAFYTSEQWLKLLKASDRNRWLALSHLGRLHYQHYCQHHCKNDLESAIAKGQEALGCLPANHPYQADVLDLLGDWLRESVADNNDAERKSQAKKSYSRAAALEGGAPARRIRAGRLAAYLHIKDKEWELAFGYLKEAVSLFPRVSPRVLPRDDQQSIVSSLSGTAGLAAACALNAGMEPEEALTVLESGRGIVSGWQIQSRSDISTLADAYPVLAERYEVLRSRISGTSYIRADTHNPDITSDLNVEDFTSFDATGHSLAENRRNDNVDLERLEREIRSQQNFENFQQPLSSKDCILLAEVAPVIVLNATPHGSHALVVMESSIEALEVPLLCGSSFSTDLASLFYNDPVMEGGLSTLGERNARLRRFLEYLWDNVGERVLKHLGFLEQAIPQQQRIIWVTNGPASLCPMHAAGYYENGSKKNMPQYVNFSYISSFRALKYSRERSTRPVLVPTTPPLVLAMNKTIGQRDLLAEREADSIKQVFTATKFKAPDIISSPSKKKALENIDSRQIVHFACHGYADINDPSKSHLLLHDSAVPGTPDQLSVADIVEATSNLGRLAYLSACSTAQHALPDFFDENINLAATFQLVGFSHVVGTLWSVGDRASIEVAKAFYADLLSRNQDEVVQNEAIPHALHEAVRLLRVTKPPGSRIRPAEDVLSWVPESDTQAGRTQKHQNASTHLILLAIQAIKLRQIKSVRAAAISYNIPSSTLFD
ncbi:hypothetical protein V496_00132 [Pseudogymnoascus sp. VKM F-4515 (FW-2607)]|nr:hypothetical protein V496_00132 [Pseudogymnoascus sp. VKM F-4515 (FW-2607)]